MNIERVKKIYAEHFKHTDRWMHSVDGKIASIPMNIGEGHYTVDIVVVDSECKEAAPVFLVVHENLLKRLNFCNEAVSPQKLMEGIIELQELRVKAEKSVLDSWTHGGVKKDVAEYQQSKIDSEKAKVEFLQTLLFQGFLSR